MILMRCTLLTSKAIRALVSLYHIAAQTAHLMVGLPDYANYAEHRRKHHPGEPIMNREEFFRDCQERRYAPAGGRGLRCC
jgi:uncharacterized short protein YbdD (DUF466 family)